MIRWAALLLAITMVGGATDAQVSQSRQYITNGLDINNASPTLGQTYGDGTLVAVETLGNVAGPSFHAGNNFLTVDNGAQFSYGATTLYAQMNFGGPTVTGGRTAGTFNTVMSAKTGNSAGSENYAGFDGYCTASANDHGTGSTITTAFGSCFGGNFIATLKNGATYWQGNVGVEVDNEVDTGASVLVNVGIQAVKLAASAVPGTTEDAAFVVGAQTGAIGWNYGLALANASSIGAFPYASTATMIGSYQSGTVSYGVDLNNITCSSDCFRSPGFTVDGTGNVTAYAAASSVYYLNAVTSANSTGIYAPAGGTVGVSASGTKVAQFNITTATLYVPEQPGVYTIAALPTCSGSVNQGAFAAVSNGVATPTYLAAPSTTGTSYQPVFCNGSAWVYH